LEGGGATGVADEAEAIGGLDVAEDEALGLEKG